MAIHERTPLPQPLDAVSMQAIMRVLQTLPTPITIERKVDERTEHIYYHRQAREKTAVKLPNRQWRIGEEALHKFINDVGGDLNALLPKVAQPKRKRPQTEALRRAQAKEKV